MKYIAILLMLASCTITKGKRTQAIDSVHVIKTDSVSLKKNTTSEKNNAEWERQVVIFNRDTTINHYLTTTLEGKQPVLNFPQPQVIIQERGSYQQEKQTINYDSIQNVRIDSLQYALRDSQKDKKEQSLSFWFVVAIAVVVSLIFFILGKLKISL